MIKKTLLFNLLLFSLIAVAQKTDENYNPPQYKTSSCRSEFSKIKLTGERNEPNIKQFLKRHLSNFSSADADLKLNYVNESPGGFHYSFIQTFKGVDIYQSEVKLNIDRQNVIRSVFDNSENTGDWIISVSDSNSNSVIILHPQTGLPVLAERRIENFSREVISSNGEIIFERDINSYFLPPDSLVTGKVFNPDPLTTSQNVYGPPFVDDTNRTNVSIDAQMQTVSFTANFNGSLFELRNQFVKVADFDTPFFPIATSVIPEFNFDRSQTGFEDVNSYYHMSKMGSYVQGLGFNCADFVVEVDPHAGLSDNSYFSPASRISLGVGGVDDAEDADVCVHEYAHFLSYNSAPGSNSGVQRSALDEAFGDYLAASYSRSINPFNQFWVYSWDGHNEFWKGRVVNTPKIYPDSLSNSIYRNGEMWSTALFNINLEIGRGATDSLILQAHYSYAQNISMADAAELLIDADTLLNNGAYYCPIYRHLFAQGFVGFNANGSCAVGIEYMNELQLQFFQNGSSFSLFNAEKEQIELQILNVTGELIATNEINQPAFNYQNENLSAGIYLVVVRTTNALKTFKWCKAN